MGDGAVARLRDSLGAEVQSLWSDDGIALHFPDADAPPSLADLLVEPQELEDLVVQEVGSTALFGARFRENAGRALLIPRRRPGQRTPLWQQRLKAQSLLEVARKYSSFPIVLETYRECLQDVFDLPALRGILRGLQTRELDLVEIETASASPMAASLLFDYVATYMYEDDTPAAERRAQALSLDRELLRELLGQEELRDLIDPGALAEVEGSLLPVPRNADELHDLLRRAGDLRGGELDAGFAETLVRERRAFRARIGAVDVVIAAEDAGLYRDAFGVMPPGGLPESFLEPVDDPMDRILLRYARSRGPFTTRDAASRFALEPGVVEGLLAVLEARDLLVRGELRPGGVEREWCDPDVLRRIRRASLAVLRRQVEPAEQAALGRFLPSWHGIDRRATLREALVPLQGLALPVALWESEILPRRVPGYQPASLDQLCASGDVVWVGAGLDRVALYYREDAAVLGPPGTGEPLAGPVHDSIRGVLAQSAEFWPDLVAAVGSEVADVLPVLWELVWNGEVTNDAWAPLRAKRRYGMPATERRPRRFSRSRVSGDVATAGRWSLSGRLFAGDLCRLPATGGRSRSSCSSGRGSSPATACAPRGFPAGTGPSTGSFARSRTSAPAGAATSSRGSAERSSRSPAPSSGSASCATPGTRMRSCSPPPSRRSHTAACSHGRDARPPVPRVWPEPTSCCCVARRRSTSSAAAARCYRCATPTPSGFAPRSRRSWSGCVPIAGGGSRSSASTDGRSSRATSCRFSSRQASSPGLGGRCCGHRWLFGDSRERLAPQTRRRVTRRGTAQPSGTSRTLDSLVLARPDFVTAVPTACPTWPAIPAARAMRSTICRRSNETGRSPRIAPLRFPCRTVYGRATPPRRRVVSTTPAIAAASSAAIAGPGPERRPVDLVAARGRRSW